MKILLVDDNPDLLVAMRRGLELDGHDVVCATNGADGLACCKMLPGGFDIIISDWQMPRMTGPVMIREILKLYPNIKTALMSGGGYDFRDLPEGTHFLAKPFGKRELQEALGL